MWVADFLHGGKNKVPWNQTESRAVIFTEGLPQGAAISPLLFIICINDITEGMSPDTGSSTFADDMGIWVCEKSRTELTRKLEQEATVITKWATENWMKLNLNKTEILIISSNKADVHWMPDVTINGERLRVARTVRFLGVILDGDLRFAAHVEKVEVKTKRRLNMMRCIAGKEWGTDKTTMRPVMEYASAAWYPWCCKTLINRLEVLQNTALRTITRVAKTTPSISYGSTLPSLPCNTACSFGAARALIRRSSQSQVQNWVRGQQGLALPSRVNPL